MALLSHNCRLPPDRREAPRVRMSKDPNRTIERGHVVVYRHSDPVVLDREGCTGYVAIASPVRRRLRPRIRYPSVQWEECTCPDLRGPPIECPAMPDFTLRDDVRWPPFFCRQPRSYRLSNRARTRCSSSLFRGRPSHFSAQSSAPATYASRRRRRSSSRRLAFGCGPRRG